MAGFKYGAGTESDIAYREEQSPTLLAGQNDAATVIATVENGGGADSPIDVSG